MRVGRVSAATLTKYGRWDACFYLGTAEDHATKIAQTAVSDAKAALQDAQRHLRNVRSAHAIDNRRVAALVADGTVQLLSDT